MPDLRIGNVELCNLQCRRYGLHDLLSWLRPENGIDLSAVRHWHSELRYVQHDLRRLHGVQSRLLSRKCYKLHGLLNDKRSLHSVHRSSSLHDLCLWVLSGLSNLLSALLNNQSVCFVQPNR